MRAWTLSTIVITTWGKDIALDQKIKVLEITCDEIVHFHVNFVKKVSLPFISFYVRQQYYQ